MNKGSVVKSVKDPKRELQAWSKREGVTPSMLAKRTKISYVYAWKLLRGDHPVTVEMVGRLVVAYPYRRVADIVKSMKMYANGGN